MSFELREGLDPAIYGPFYDEDHGGSTNDMYRIFSGLTVMAAFMAIGRFPGFTPAHVAAATPIEVHTIGNLTIYGHTLVEATAIAAEAATGVISVETGGLLWASAILGVSFRTGTFTVQSLVALNNYVVPTPWALRFANFGGYLGGFSSPIGGFSYQPGFPDFIGGGHPPTHPWGGGHGGLVCYTVGAAGGNEVMCFWEY